MSTQGTRRGARWGRRRVIAACLVLASSIPGCAHVGAAGPIWTVPPAEVSFPPTVPLPTLPGDCTRAYALAPGEPAPCTGVLLGSADLDLLVREEALLSQCRAALDLAYDGRVADRETCETIRAARETQLREALRARERWFGAGLVLGVVGVAAGAVGLGLAAGK